MKSFQNLFHRGRQSKHRQQSDILERLGHVHEDSIVKYQHGGEYSNKIERKYIRNK